MVLYDPPTRDGEETWQPLMDLQPSVDQMASTSISENPKPDRTVGPSKHLATAENIAACDTPSTGTTPVGVRPKYRDKSRELSGWKAGVALSATLAVMVLIINIVLTTWAIIRYGVQGGIGDLYVGNCETVDKSALVLHLVINGLSSMLLSASNYVMQCINSPTRSECDRTHSRGDWLDIGVISLRNLTRIDWKRSAVWILLAASSLPIHLLYNSGVFKTIDANLYSAILATPRYLGADPILPPLWVRVREVHEAYLANSSSFAVLSTSDCIAAYSATFVSGYNYVILLTYDELPQYYNTSAIDIANAKLLVPGNGNDIPPYSWICDNLPYGSHDGTCDVARVKHDAENWTLWDCKVDHCLAQKVEPHCKLQFSLYVLIAVIVCNFFKAAVMLWTLFCMREDTFVTFGDAVSSWLRVPDEFTKNRCLMSKRDVIDNKSRMPAVTTEGPPPIVFRGKAAHSWRHAVSLKQWTSTIVTSVIALTAAVALFHMGEATVLPNSQETLFSLGFGRVNPRAMVITNLPQFGNSGLIAAVLLANTPQVIITFIYQSYNALYTSMHLAHEWSGYRTHRKGLRVTTPRGDQRSTYWLHLPYAYAVPLTVSSSLLHWLVSQSFFLSRVASHDGITESDLSAVGFSLAPTLMAIILGSLMVIVLIGMGFRGLDSCMPVAGSCSFVMSAAAHSPETRASLPVKWGALAEAQEGELGRCCFTSLEVVPLVLGRRYA